MNRKLNLNYAFEGNNSNEAIQRKQFVNDIMKMGN